MLEDLKNWNQLCSSLDVIGDTSIAVKSYEECEWPEDTGMQYILIYGLLQALVVQQDAVRHLREVLNVENVEDLELQEIRDIRNRSVGHPTKQNAGKNRKSFNFISRISMSKKGFDLLSSYGERNSDDHRSVSLSAFIQTQEEELSKSLGEVLNKLEKEEMEHKEKFKDEKLRNLFSRSIPYYVEKIFDEILSTQRKGLGGYHVSLIQDTITKFVSQLEKRGLLPAYEHAAYEIEDTTYALDELAKYFDHEKESKLNDRDANIYTCFLNKQLEMLEEIAKSIDDKYEA